MSINYMHLLWNKYVEVTISLNFLIMKLEVRKCLFHYYVYIIGPEENGPTEKEQTNLVLTIIYYYDPVKARL